MQALRGAVGLRDLAMRVQATTTKKAAAAPLAVFKQYREADGRFYFKLVEGERVLLQSTGFESPKEAGARIAMLKRGTFDQGATDVAVGDGVAIEDVHAALAALLAAEADKA
jgi:tryptophanyl-tRNA synthetase